MSRTLRVTALCLALILALAQIASASAVLDRAVEIISKMETNGNYGQRGQRHQRQPERRHPAVEQRPRGQPSEKDHFGRP